MTFVFFFSPWNCAFFCILGTHLFFLHIYIYINNVSWCACCIPYAIVGSNVVVVLRIFIQLSSESGFVRAADEGVCLIFF